jgi:hypothetical protein
VKTLATTSSRPDPETLATCEVLAHPRMMFYPCMCGLRRAAAAIAAALIGCDDVEVDTGTTMRRR